MNQMNDEVIWVIYCVFSDEILLYFVKFTVYVVLQWENYVEFEANDGLIWVIYCALLMNI